MDLQATFDAVAMHLIVQNKRAIHVEDENKLPKMMYVTPDGLKCAIGCLFYTNTYHPDMEGYSFKGVDTWKQHAENDGLTKMREALRMSGVYVDDEKVLRMLTDLQHVHDNHEPEFWEARLTAVARTWRVSDYMIQIAVEKRNALQREAKKAEQQRNLL